MTRYHCIRGKDPRPSLCQPRSKTRKLLQIMRRDSWGRIPFRGRPTRPLAGCGAPGHLPPAGNRLAPTALPRPLPRTGRSRRIRVRHAAREGPRSLTSSPSRRASPWRSGIFWASKGRIASVDPLRSCSGRWNRFSTCRRRNRSSCWISLTRSCKDSEGKGMKGVRFVVDEAGQKTDVIINLKTNPELWEDIYDRSLARKRSTEPRESLESVKRRLAARHGRRAHA